MGHVKKEDTSDMDAIVSTTKGKNPGSSVQRSTVELLPFSVIDGMSDAPATIFVRFIGEGFHAWPDAPESRAYLRDKHRHLFHIEARCTVGHFEREIEYHDLRDKVEVLYGLLAGPARDFGSQSCETIAHRLGSHLVEAFARPFTVLVSEDGECGSVVSCSP
jgi:hypothetical protein